MCVVDCMITHDNVALFPCRESAILGGVENDTTQDQASAHRGAPPQRAARTPAPAAAWLAGAALAVGVAVLFLQFTMLRVLDDVRAEAEEAQAGAAAAVGRVDGLRTDVEGLAETLDQIDTELAAAAIGSSIGAGESSAAGAAQATDGLPPYPTSGADPAVQAGMAIGPISGDEYYSQSRLTIEPDGDTATVWLIWAHWCPHCQTELPELSAFWEQAAADYPHVEVVTITSSIDPSRGNPLEAYLDESGFPFPVLVDPDNSLATTLGTTAFPFWVVTGPDGRVLLRRPGALGLDQMTGLFGSVEEFVAG